MPRYTPARSRELSRCDSAEDHQDELDRQDAEDDHQEEQALWWADFNDEEN